MDINTGTKVRLVVGTYEEFVLGYSIDLDDKSRPILVRQFANRSHTASVRCVGTCAKYLASGGADENIVICDLERKKETGSVMNHNGTVNCLKFSPDSCHIISGGDEGTIAVVRCGSWVMEKAWKCAHKIRDKQPAAVTGLAIHPSGKMLLSIGKDKMIRTWNLITGRPVHFTNVASRCNREEVGSIVWSLSGNRYAVCVGSLVDVYSISTAGIVCSITVSGKAISICFLEDDLLSIGEDSGSITVHELKDKQDSDTVENIELISFDAHKSRVKCINLVKKVPSVEENVVCFVSAGSDGTISLWKLQEESIEMIHEVKTGCRITCMDVINDEPSNQKKKCKKVKVNNCKQISTSSNLKDVKRTRSAHSWKVSSIPISTSSNLKDVKRTRSAHSWKVSSVKISTSSNLKDVKRTRSAHSWKVSSVKISTSSNLKDVKRTRSAHSWKVSSIKISTSSNLKDVKRTRSAHSWKVSTNKR